MSEQNLDEIVNAVTQQVLEALRAGDAADTPETEGKEKLLIVGEKECVPEALCRNAVLYGMEDYRTAGNILRYQRIVITQLTINELADIALGRPTDEASGVVVEALLNGVEVVMLEKALPHRKYAGKGSTSLYHLLESYARTIQVFGVRLLGNQLHREQPALLETKPPKFQKPAVSAPRGKARPNIGRLITEATAHAMIDGGTDAVHIPADAIVTPSARDAFAQAQIAVIKDA
jgi:ethanolamine utilization protein